MNKRIMKFGAVLMSALQLGGCGFITSADSLLSPPKLTEDQRAVYDALKSEVGSFNPVYPARSGISSEEKRRSAYIIEDLDGDGEQEAVVFYRPADKGDSVIRMNMLKEHNGKWRSVYDHAGMGNSLDISAAVCLGNNDRLYIIAGYDLMTAGDRVMEIYSCKNSVVETVYSDSYDECFVTDMTGDNANELISVNYSQENKSACVSLVTDNNGVPECSSTVSLSEGISGFENIMVGRLSPNTPALFIDEINGSDTLSTEIIYCVDGKLRNPAATENSTIIEETARLRGYCSADVDGDGITEIPVTELLPGYANETEQMYLTRWNVFEDYELVRRYNGWYSKGQEWCMMFPGRWDGLITMRTDSASGAAVFCKYNSSVESSTELMRIIAVNNSRSPDYLDMGWQLITSYKQTDYLVRLSEDKNESLVLTSTEVRNNFYVLRND